MKTVSLHTLTSRIQGAERFCQNYTSAEMKYLDVNRAVSTLLMTETFVNET